MIFLYHRVPKHLHGHILYPLNVLKEIIPEAYQYEVRKYRGREDLLSVRIPLLNCLWNDVLHMTAVHPVEIKQALVDAGRSDEFTLEYFAINPNDLNADQLIVYRYLQADNRSIEREDNFVPFNQSDIETLKIIPQVTKDYWRECIAHGKKPLIFYRIPHVLYKGSLDISGAQRILV